MRRRDVSTSCFSTSACPKGLSVQRPVRDGSPRARGGLRDRAVQPNARAAHGAGARAHAGAAASHLRVVQARARRTEGTGRRWSRTSASTLVSSSVTGFVRPAPATCAGTRSRNREDCAKLARFDCRAIRVVWCPATESCRLVAPVAQLDRALASGAKGRRFESCRARHPPPLAEEFRASYGEMAPSALDAPTFVHACQQRELWLAIARVPQVGR
jgi:hypothetical protein